MHNSCLIYHAVFYATDNQNRLTPAFNDPFGNCISDYFLNSGNRILEFGGSSEHLHVLFETIDVTPIGELLEKIKLQGLRWIQQQSSSIPQADLTLKIAYFTVSYSMAGRIKRFIADQTDHHQTVSFEDEFLSLLDKHEVRYNEQELWCRA
ncbi:MAG: transposase [Pirellulaceae bacterium]|jgi:putative transposase|nr:transposase [Pirellulaceae bacterium]